jgi:hypothetical protein
MALIAEALTTVEEAERFLRRRNILGMEFDEVESLVNGFGAAFARYCQRQFTPERDGTLQKDLLLTNQTKKFRYDGNGYLSLAPYEIRTVAEIKIDTDLPGVRILEPGSGSVESEYRLEPRQKTILGTYLWLDLPVYDLTAARRRHGREISVRGDWGAAEGKVPYELELATWITVANAFENPADFASREYAGVTVSEPAETEAHWLPRAARLLLRRHMRTGLAAAF